MQDDMGRGRTPWTRFGFLIADLFTALAMLFLVANTQAHLVKPPSPPTPTLPPTPTATPGICGLETQPGYMGILQVDSPNLLRTGDLGAEQQFAAAVQQAFTQAGDQQRIAGLVEVYGGSLNGNLDVGDGEALANGAIASLKLLAGKGFIFTSDRTLYQPLWSGTLNPDQVQLLVFFYRESANGQSCTIRE